MPLLKPAPLTLYCFPCAGGSAASYLRWRRRLPSWICVQPVELPGRGARMRQALISDFDLMIERLTEEVVRDPLRPYAFFGHSLGALLAYGCANALRDRGRNLPALLILACCAAPSKRDDARLSHLKGDEALIRELKRLKGTPAELFQHTELLRITLDALAADFALLSSFVYRGPSRLALDILVLGGRDDSIDEEDLAAWSAEASGRTAAAMFDGGHFFFREDEDRFLDYLGRQLSDAAWRLNAHLN